MYKFMFKIVVNDNVYSSYMLLTESGQLVSMYAPSMMLVAVGGV